MIYQIFIAHPKSVGETYFGHLAFALSFASKLLLASAAALVHALIPALFETTASRIIKSLYCQLESGYRLTESGHRLTESGDATQET